MRVPRSIRTLVAAGFFLTRSFPHPYDSFSKALFGAISKALFGAISSSAVLISLVAEK
jgi:hypothetical protein